MVNTQRMATHVYCSRTYLMYCTVNIAVKQISNQLQSLMSATPGWVLSLRGCSLYAGVPHLAREQSSESIIHAMASMNQAHRRQIASYSDFRSMPANLLLSHLAAISRVLNAIIQPCKRANQSHTRTKSPRRLHSRAAACSSLPLPKQLHANLQCEMSIRLLISVEGSPLIHPKAVEVILSQSF